MVSWISASAHPLSIWPNDTSKHFVLYFRLAQCRAICLEPWLIRQAMRLAAGPPRELASWICQPPTPSPPRDSLAPGFQSLTLLLDSLTSPYIYCCRSSPIKPTRFLVCTSTALFSSGRTMSLRKFWRRTPTLSENQTHPHRDYGDSLYCARGTWVEAGGGSAGPINP